MNVNILPLMRWECRNIYLNIHTLLKITYNFKKMF